MLRRLLSAVEACFTGNSAPLGELVSWDRQAEGQSPGQHGDQQLGEVACPAPIFRPGSISPTPTSTRSGYRSKSLPRCGRPRPIWWNEQAPGTGGGFHDGGYWAITKHKRRQRVSRRSDVFSSYENGVIPRFDNDIAREDIDLQRFVMLNMDAPHHTRLRKHHLPWLHPARRRTPARRTQRARPEHRQGRGGCRLRRLRRAGVV